MYSFRNDYSEGAHPLILEALTKTNLEQTIGYGEDPFCQQAREQIAAAIGRSDADIHFLVGGTQANAVVIKSALRPHQAAVAVESGHINVHETGAIEATGHKVVVVPGVRGKMTPEALQKAVNYHCDEHMVQPKLAYISQTTEIGTYYTLKELEALRACCDQNNLFLYVDGARLASALPLPEAPSLKDLGRLADAFYIGGTKCGALFGEAVVLLNPVLKADFRYLMKQHGAMLAKGRLMGVQFSRLFQDNLYTEIGLHENQMAIALKDGLSALGIPFLCDSISNQQFPILENRWLEPLSQEFQFEQMQEECGPGKTCIRLVTSWATPQDAAASFVSALKKLMD